MRDNASHDYPDATWIPAECFAIPTGKRVIMAAILHSADGTLVGDLAQLTGDHGVSAHYYVARSGRVWQMVLERNIAWHAGAVRKPTWNNAHTIGIEQEHVDHREDWPDTQLLAVARLVNHIRVRRGPIPLLGHADVASPPGRKQDPADYPWAELHVAIMRLADTAAAATGIPT